ncbi:MULTISPECIES: carboxylate--amine ligase [Priestia]|uniref:carboxylate--amine ligase n=1 Tax=Priestia TaxID=2800373 RepID=UPI00119E9E52|nr:carbamoyl-phosphate synthase [Priestia flexa]MCA1201064.1 carbamoyl-phosphate synthase [Priestia flexa]
MNDKHAAVVLDLSANGLGIIKRLAERNIEIYAFDTEKSYRIGKTKLATCSPCPSPLTEEKELLDVLITLGKKQKHKPVLYTGADDYVIFISKYREELSNYFLFLFPDHDVIEQVLDKQRAYNLALKHNIPCPKTFIIKSEDDMKTAIETLEFPCILKPVLGHEFRKIINKKAILIQTAEQLQAEYPTYQQAGDLIVQEIIPGDNSCFYKVATFFDENMNLLAQFSLQKNHQFPAQFGTGAHIVSKTVPELFDICLPFFKAIHLKGVAMAEFKKDPRDGVYKFIEINPRFWLTHSLTGAAGIDFVYLYYLSMTEQQPIPHLVQKDGVKWIYLVRYYLTYLTKRKQEGMTLRDFLSGFKGEKEWALFSLRDPMPFVRSAYSHLVNAWKNKRKEK